jgi:outer membrane lipoprotein-sorting protein
MKTTAVGIGFMVWAWLGVGGAQAFSVSYEQKVTKGREVYAAKVAMKDEMFRMEAKVEGRASVIIRNAEGTYTYMPDEGMAMKLPLLDESQQPVKHADNYAQYLKEVKAQRLGSETVNGHPCDVYRFTDPSVKGATTAWVWTQKQFPIKLEIDSPDGKVIVELTNIQIGADIPESVFRLPSDVQVMDIGSMMKMR